MAEERGAEALIFRVAPHEIAAADDPVKVAAMAEEMGAPSLLASIAKQAADVKPDVVVWGCTSGSFLGEGSALAEQANEMSQALGGIPATTTSLAILDALNQRQITHAGVVTPYHAEIGSKFTDYLRRNGFTADGEAHAGCGSDAEVGNLTIADLVPLVNKVVRPETEALVIPCTGLRRQKLEQQLSDEFGVQVVFGKCGDLGSRGANRTIGNRNASNKCLTVNPDQQPARNK